MKENPPWIIVTSEGEIIFEGNQLHWADCFFSNAYLNLIKDYSEDNGWTVEIRPMTDEEFLILDKSLQELLLTFESE